MFDKLKLTKNYRDFLQTYLELQKLNLSDFAQTTGFGRSFPSDVLKNKRRLTAKSGAAFEKALKLPVAGKMYFKLLVAQEESDVFIEIDRKKIPAQLTQLREKSWERKASRHQLDRSEKRLSLFNDSRTMEVYAAAGSPSQGATLEQITSRVNLNSSVLSRLLGELLENDFLILKENTYFPQDLHTFLQLAEGNALLKSTFQAAARRASERVQSFQNDSEFFFSSQFCINAEKLPELKKNMRELILSFVDDSINEDGNRVVKVVTSLHL